MATYSNKLLIKKTINADGDILMKDGKDEDEKEAEEDSFIEYRESMVDLGGLEPIEF